MSLEQAAPVPVTPDEVNLFGSRPGAASNADGGAIVETSFDAGAIFQPAVALLRSTFASTLAYACQRPVTVAVGAGALLFATIAIGIVAVRQETPNITIPQNAIIQYVTRDDTSLRNGPSGQGSAKLATLQRGQLVEGEWQTAKGGSPEWFKIEVGRYAGGYIWGRNLSPVQPPAVQTWVQSVRVIVRSSDLHTSPDESASVLQHVESGTSTFVVAQLADGWVEVALKRGGVGYLPSSSFAITSVRHAAH